MLFLVLHLVAFTLTKPIPPRNIITSINCGTLVQIKTSLGVQFEKDYGYSNNTYMIDHHTGEPELVDSPLVKYTPDKAIYLSERTSEDSFSYQLPLNNRLEQNYVLIFKFAEFTHKQTGQRRFDIYIGNIKVVSELDVYALVGFAAAHDEYIEFSQRDKKIYYQNQECSNALNEKNELIVKFEKTNMGQPFISAIVLTMGTLEDTDYMDRQEYIEEWKLRYPNKTKEEKKLDKQIQSEQRKAKIEKRKSILKIREGFEKEIGIEVKQEKAEEIKPKVSRRQKLRWLSWEELKLVILNPFGMVLIVGFLISSFVVVKETLFKSVIRVQYIYRVYKQETIERQRLIQEYYDRKSQQQRENDTASSSDSSPQQRRLIESIEDQGRRHQVIENPIMVNRGKVSPKKKEKV